MSIQTCPPQFHTLHIPQAGSRSRSQLCHAPTTANLTNYLEIQKLYQKNKFRPHCFLIYDGWKRR